MRLGKVLCRSAMRTLSLCSSDIHGKYVAQFTCGSVAVKIVVICELIAVLPWRQNALFGSFRVVARGDKKASNSLYKRM